MNYSTVAKENHEILEWNIYLVIKFIALRKLFLLLIFLLCKRVKIMDVYLVDIQNHAASVRQSILLVYIIINQLHTSV
jgi:hypothetical protein